MLAKLPLSFEENRGQANKETRFLARGAGYALLVKSDGLVLNLKDKQGAAMRSLKMKLIGTQKSELHGSDLSATKTNYYLGNKPENWLVNVPSYHSIVSSQVYKGIDLVYRGNGRELEYDFRIAPGADAAQVHMRFDGLTPVPRGSDLYFGDSSLLSLKALQAYQIVGHETRKVDASWAVSGDEASIHLGPYDQSRELIIDPIFFYGTYVGGDSASGGATNDDAVSIVPASQAGYYYVALSTSSELVYEPQLPPGDQQLPLTPVSHNPSPSNAMILGIDTTNSPGPPSPVPPLNNSAQPHPTLVVNSITYFGDFGTNTVPTSMVGDGAANLYMVGTQTANLTQLGTQRCLSSCVGFIAKFATSLDPNAHSATIALKYSYGLPAAPAAVAVDQAGDTYLTGSALSPSGTQGLTIPPKDVTFQNAVASSLGQSTSHAFLLELDPGGTTLFCSYVGGSGVDKGNAIALSGNSVFVAGETTSPDFPKSSGAYQGKGSGGEDAFVLAASNLVSTPALTFAALLGGSDQDTASSIAVAPSGNVIVAGSTKSVDFPTQPSPSFSIVQWPLVNSNGVDGGTTSLPTTPPIINPLPTAVPSGSQSAFVTDLSADGKNLIFTDFLGGNEDNDVTGANAVAVDNIGAIYVVGSTTATTSGLGQTVNVPFLSGFATVDRAGGGITPEQGKANVFFGEIDPSGSNLIEGTLAWGFGTNTARALTISGPSAPVGIVSIVGSTDDDVFYGAESSTLDPVRPVQPKDFKAHTSPKVTSGFFAQESLAGYCDMHLTAEAGNVFTFSGPCVSGTNGGTLFASASPANGKPPIAATIAIASTPNWPFAAVSVDVSSLTSANVSFTFGFLPLGAAGGLGACGVTGDFLSGCAINTAGGGSGTIFNVTSGQLGVQLTYDNSTPVTVGQPITLSALVTNGIPNTVTWISTQGTFKGPNPASSIVFTPAGAGGTVYVQAIPVANPSVGPTTLPIAATGAAAPGAPLAIIGSVPQMVAKTTYLFVANQDVSWNADAGAFSPDTVGLFTAPDPGDSLSTVTITAKSNTTGSVTTAKVVIYPKLTVMATSAVTVAAGKPGQVVISVKAGSGIPGESMLFTCVPAKLPTGVSCSFSPDPVTNSNSPKVTLTISSGAVAQERRLLDDLWQRFAFGGSSIVIAGCLLFVRPRLGKHSYMAAIAGCALLSSLGLTACGTGGTIIAPSRPGHVTGTYMIEINVQGATANAGDLDQSLATIPVSLTIQ